MAGGGDASQDPSEMPSWAFTMQAVLMAFTDKALRNHFGYLRENRTINLDEVLKIIISGMLAAGLSSLVFTLGHNYFPAIFGIPGMVPNHYQWCVAMVVTCGFKTALGRAQVINNPRDLTSDAYFQLEVRALRMTSEAPLAREALVEEMRRLQIESRRT